MDRPRPRRRRARCSRPRDWVGSHSVRWMLRRPARRAGERCELCNAPIPSAHRHLLELSSRELMCACRPCSLLFDRDGAGNGRYKLVPERRLRLEDFAMSEQAWEELRIPVEMAFFFHSSAAERVLAYYPGPMGPTESQLQLSSWQRARAGEPDPRRARARRRGAAREPRCADAHRHWLVPLGRVLRPRRADPHALEGPARAAARCGSEIDRFFEELDRRARSATAKEMTMAEGIMTMARSTRASTRPHTSRASTRATRVATTRRWPATGRTAPRRRSARPAFSRSSTNRSTRACRTSRRPRRGCRRIPQPIEALDGRGAAALLRGRGCRRRALRGRADARTSR